MFESSYELSDRLRDLVHGGVVTVHVEFTQTGMDTWVRTTQPHPRLGVFPHESMSVSEALEKLTKVKIPGAPEHSVYGRTQRSSPPRGVGATLYPPPPTQNAELEYMTLPKAQAIIEREGLSSVTRSNGLVCQSPKKSLTSYDLEHPALHLMARCVVIAHELGNATIMARITTNSALQILGAGDLQTWWKKATSLQRLTVLSDAKKISPHARARLTLANESGLSKIGCPFRKLDDLVDIPAQTKAPTEWEDSE